MSWTRWGQIFKAYSLLLPLLPNCKNLLFPKKRFTENGSKSDLQVMFFYNTHYCITREVTFGIFGTFGSLFCALIANKSFRMFPFCYGYDEAPRGAVFRVYEICLQKLLEMHQNCREWYKLHTLYRLKNTFSFFILTYNSWMLFWPSHLNNMHYERSFN